LSAECYRLGILACLCALWAIPAHAQEIPSVTETADRPGFSDSPVLLGRGRVQIESGFMMEREDDGPKSTRTLTWPQAELHTGINTHLDFSVTWDGLITTTDLTSTSSGETRTTGGADVRLGAKFGLANRPHVNTALIGYVYLPVGSASVSGGYADPQARLAWAASITDSFGFGGTGDLGAVREDDGHVRAKPAVSASLAGKVSGALGGFAGFVAESAELSSTLSVWSAQAGLVFPLGMRHQLDVWVGRHVSGGPDDYFLSAGFVRRLR
jgi:Putative MetA-pathway of phenol degradation